MCACTVRTPVATFILVHPLEGFGTSSKDSISAGDKGLMAKDGYIGEKHLTWPHKGLANRTLFSPPIQCGTHIGPKYAEELQIKHMILCSHITL